MVTVDLGGIEINVFVKVGGSQDRSLTTTLLMIYIFMGTSEISRRYKASGQYCAPIRMETVVGRWLCGEQALGTEGHCVTDVDHQHVIGYLHQPPQVRREKGLPVFLRGVA